MPIDWKIRLLDWLLRRNQPIYHLSLEELHQLPLTPIPGWITRLLFGQKIALPQVTDRTIPGRQGDIPIRLYHPSLQPNLPLLLFFHGGGWVAGNFQTHDSLCRRLAHDTGAIVLAVEYRLAPWFKYPAALDDCEDVLLWAAQADSTIGAAGPILVIGDSAGGNLATALCLRQRSRDGQSSSSSAPIAAQILLYPVTDGTLSQPSMSRYANAPLLTKPMMQFYVQHYARTESDCRQPEFSPLLAEDLSHLPPALIITAEYDPLCDDGQHYAERLRAAGNSVQTTDYAGMVHGFMSFPPFCRGALPAFAEIATFVRQFTG
ncbi:MAG: alpha/beta hydrolase [Elainella sp.]